MAAVRVTVMAQLIFAGVNPVTFRCIPGGARPDFTGLGAEPGNRGDDLDQPTRCFQLFSVTGRSSAVTSRAAQLEEVDVSSCVVDNRGAPPLAGYHARRRCGPLL